MIDLGRDEHMRLEMGENGYRRVMDRYRLEDMHETYENLYQKFSKDQGIEWKTEVFEIQKS